MAKQKNNIIMRSTRGMVGKQIVFKRRAGKTYVAAPPETNDNRLPTANQRANRLKFKTSVAFAKVALKDPDTKNAYLAAAKRGQSAFNVAFKDAYMAPQVLGIITQGYLGQAGNIIVVQAADDFKVNTVLVSIHNSANELIEEGPAAANADGLNWSYVATQPNATIAGTRIKARALDIPENEGTLEVTL